MSGGMELYLHMPFCVRKCAYCDFLSFPSGAKTQMCIRDRDDNLLASGIFNTGNSGIILEKLNDYDYLMKKFYNVHPTTTASRDLMQAETFLSTDLSIEKNADSPQILIYHTHSQETYADYPENPEADVIHLGEELAVLLRERGYNVFHDESVYDYRDGKLDQMCIRDRIYSSPSFAL